MAHAPTSLGEDLAMDDLECRRNTGRREILRPRYAGEERYAFYRLAFMDTVTRYFACAREHSSLSNIIGRSLFCIPLDQFVPHCRMPSCDGHQWKTGRRTPLANHSRISRPCND